LFSFVGCCYPTFDPCFGKFSEKSKNIKKTSKIQKNTFFNIFASFLAFSASSKKEFKFLRVFRTRSTFHASFLKSLIFFIESTMILLVFKEHKKIKKKIKFTKRKKLRDQV